jgi:xylulokinase
VRGGFFNQSLDTTREHMIRAVFEGVAFNGRWLLKVVEKFISRRMDSIRLIGGGAHSDVWCQIFADIFDRTIYQVKKPILANVRGAGFLASLALGYIKVEDIAESVEVIGVYSPNPAHRKIYDSMFKEFMNIYKCNRRIFARLNKK